MKVGRVFAFLLLLACAPVCLAQKEKGKEKPYVGVDEEQERERRQYEWLVPKREPGSESLPAALAGALSPVELPKGADAWVVQVVTRGGFAGAGRGDVTVTSARAVACKPDGACAGGLPTSAFESLAALVAAAKPSRWVAPSVGPCRDCYVTALVLRRRDAKGREKTYTTYWDDATYAGAPEEARRIYESAFAHVSRAN